MKKVYYREEVIIDTRLIIGYILQKSKFRIRTRTNRKYVYIESLIHTHTRTHTWTLYKFNHVSAFVISKLSVHVYIDTIMHTNLFENTSHESLNM